jgi:peptidoglycan-N-acetylglucosamine deacetylase
MQRGKARPARPAPALSAHEAQARRRLVLRRRTVFAAVLAAAAAALLAALLSGGGSHTHAHASAIASGSAARAGSAKRLAGRSASTSSDAGESDQVRALIALGLPIYCAGARGNEVALTFDDGPGPYTQLVLAKLRKHGIRATFFDVARNIPLLPGATAAERALGGVGDHTVTHPLLTALAPAGAEREIVRAQAALERSTGGPVFLFRPPYGGRSASIDRVVSAHGMLDILWTLDSADSLGATYAQIERNVIGGLRAGAIVLMHENHGQTVRALLAIFAALARKHLRAVSVSQLLTDDPPSVAQVRAGGAGCGVRAGGLSGS